MSAVGVFSGGDTTGEDMNKQEEGRMRLYKVGYTAHLAVNELKNNKQAASSWQRNGHRHRGEAETETETEKTQG